MVTKNIQQAQFQDRLKRISAGGVNTSGQLYAGIVVEREPDKNVKKIKPVKIRKKRVRRRYASIPVALLSGILIGGVAVVLARYIRFQADGSALTGPDSDLMMMVDVVFAITIAIVLRTLFRFKSQVHGFGKFVGVMAMILLMQNAVHLAPGLFERTFSVAWVDAVLSTTQPNSILLAGVSYDAAPLLDQAETQAVRIAE